VLRAAGETQTTQENIQDLLELDEGPRISVSDKRKNFCSDIFYLLSSELPILLNFQFICFLSFSCLLELSYASLILIID
jgi:hypothetical protein